MAGVSQESAELLLEYEKTASERLTEQINVGFRMVVNCKIKFCLNFSQ